MASMLHGLPRHNASNGRYNRLRRTRMQLPTPRPPTHWLIGPTGGPFSREWPNAALSSPRQHGASVLAAASTTAWANSVRLSTPRPIHGGRNRRTDRNRPGVVISTPNACSAIDLTAPCRSTNRSSGHRRFLTPIAAYRRRGRRRTSHTVRLATGNQRNGRLHPSEARQAFRDAAGGIAGRSRGRCQGKGIHGADAIRAGATDRTSPLLDMCVTHGRAHSVGSGGEAPCKIFNPTYCVRGGAPSSSWSSSPPR